MQSCPCPSPLYLSSPSAHVTARTNEGQCECVYIEGVGAIGFPSCSAHRRNRAGGGRDPWDGDTELRKELLCSHLNRDRYWKRREVGQTKDSERKQGAACKLYVYLWVPSQIKRVIVNASSPIANFCS